MKKIHQCPMCGAMQPLGLPLRVGKYRSGLIKEARRRGVPVQFEPAWPLDRDEMTDEQIQKMERNGWSWDGFCWAGEWVRVAKIRPMVQKQNAHETENQLKDNNGY